MKPLGYFLQLTGLVLLPSVLLWALMGHVDARLELTLLAVGAALFYAGTLCLKEKS